MACRTSDGEAFCLGRHRQRVLWKWNAGRGMQAAPAFKFPHAPEEVADAVDSTVGFNPTGTKCARTAAFGFESP